MDHGTFLIEKIVEKDQIGKLKQKFKKMMDEDGLITLKQVERLLNKLPSLKNNPELIQLYLRVSLSFPLSLFQTTCYKNIKILPPFPLPLIRAGYV